MALPPERISVKRRRDETPIETFYLEENSRAKRRITASSHAFQFRLVQAGTIAPISQRPPTTQRTVSTPAIAKPGDTSNAIPTVRTTAPGDEIADFAKLKVVNAQTVPSSLQGRVDGHGTAVTIPTISSPNAKPATNPSVQSARRFHLTRDLSATPLCGIQANRGLDKPRSSIRPPLPTFIERSAETDKASSNRQPAELETASGVNQSDTEHSSNPAEEAAAYSSKGLTPSLIKPNTGIQDGMSLNDPSVTWNKDSDQLADELAALAMDMDPDYKADDIVNPVATNPSKSAAVENRDDYVYETYIRMPVSPLASDIDGKPIANIGVLVIDEADEELWQEYMASDEDEPDWDEEDSNAEDNPVNDYPEDEVSSDDEYDRNVYRYHKGDDEYGFDDDDDDDK